MPCIDETTELVPMTLPKQNGVCDPELMKSKEYKFQNFFNGNYKIDPTICKNAEYIMGKQSLDNTDLTVTSLNFIDDNQKNGNKAIYPPIESFFDNKTNKSLGEAM